VSNSEAEMRQVMLHAAEKLHAARQIRTTGYNDPLPPMALSSMAYAEGILRLLSSYLKVEPDQRAKATPEPGLLAGAPQTNGHGLDPAQRFSRDAAIIEAVRKGKTKASVAREFGLSPRRIGQIIDEASKEAADVQ
jgi:hypothetical protein